MNLTVIGTGYVGLVTGTCFAEMGNKVYCVDIDENKINNLKKGIIPIYEPHLATMVIDNQAKNNLFFTTDLREALDDSNIIFIAVGTPEAEDGSVNLNYVFTVAEQIAQNITKKSLIVTKSTVPVGTGFKIKEIINQNTDVNIQIASNPEFLKEGVAIEDCLHPDRVIIGTGDEKSAEILRELYEPFVSNHDRFIFMDVKSAEMTKYVANAMLATKISFMNEIANICEKTGANVQSVRLGIGSDKRIGYKFIYAGCGYGGSCFPKDVKGLINTSQEHGYTPSILSMVDEVNENQKMIIVDKITKRFGDDLSNLTFGVWGLSFKPQTDDVRSAPSITIISELLKRGAKVKAYDPKAVETFKAAVASDDIEYVKFKYDVLDDSNALILITEWKEFRSLDLDELGKRLHQKIIFDGRNIYPKRIEDEGFELYQIGC
ncbi:MAG: UDP-glucose/GDP-mannose dehydrogenase family protein [Methanobrevibacter millerae]|uniref:UDP-glucose 6-dehydrogenase n=1 Tax=Methanobrevibacter millerae TaxID=230361 RepID=A0A8T3VJJ5_9EURY|nr:UDP-glucose/GDP-mannose dehydrogenase family protein [Methanobrevibacter millerae]MBE6504334.1 UDP-glucose/GDP-mannose dehydrogenase family protein [Methanobrevibacter millerae]